MRRGLLTCALVLFAGTGWAQDFIRYHPPSTPAAGVGLSYASNVLTLQNGGTASTTVPQSLYIYTFCDGVNCATGYERLALITTSGGNDIIRTQAAGTGTVRGLSLFAGTADNSSLILADNAGNGVKVVGGGGHLVPAAGTGDAYDIGGATGSGGFRNFFLARSIQGSKAKTLTDAAGAVSFVRIAVPTNANMGGKLIYVATSTDGANGSLTSTAEYNFSGADLGGTVTCGISSQLGVAPAYSRANTLVCSVTAVTATTNCDLQVTCTDNKAGSQTVTFNWRLDMPIANTVTPQ